MENYIINDGKNEIIEVDGASYRRLCIRTHVITEADDIVAVAEKYAKPHVEKGDVLAVLVTGAYNYSMASNYNRIPRPPVVMVKDGAARVVVRRETYEDVANCDV